MVAYGSTGAGTQRQRPAQCSAHGGVWAGGAVAALFDGWEAQWRWRGVAARQERECRRLTGMLHAVEIGAAQRHVL
jgi:hypothetical protein